MNQIVTRSVLSDGIACRASPSWRDKLPAVQENVELCHSRPTRWQFGILFSEMTFSHSLQSEYQEMPVVDFVVAANERFLASP